MTVNSKYIFQSSKLFLLLLPHEMRENVFSCETNKMVPLYNIYINCLRSEEYFELSYDVM